MAAPEPMSRRSRRDGILRVIVLAGSVVAGPVLAVAVLALVTTVPAVAREESAGIAASQELRIETADLDRFWEAWDAAADARTWNDSIAVFERLYQEPGSPGLKDFFRARIENVPNLLWEVRSAPRYYAGLRAQTPRVAEFVPEIERSFRRWAEIYPEAEFPEVYFVIGRRNSGGTTSRNRILIGTEMYGRTPDSPEEEMPGWLGDVLAPLDRLPTIVAHELIHTQQVGSGDRRLLASAIREGMADFFGEMISGGQINERVHAWAAPREAELWADFQKVMNGTDNAGWLYSARAEGEPNDLGYWIGYRISKAYYNRAPDKTATLREMLTLRTPEDFDAFLAASGYDGR